ncbi:uncharacterized protein LOC111373777 [Olea europaea var. sylvestris]|uniref:uncharacterized protein LOC111373777 n=1 Tax=Olea europaea var. sylvestris TaxID=158386 RepID=UPI000C1D84ED|nr:uncharacterized protein LOC111373777 [Olea europaea var. sylvestris]
MSPNSILEVEHFDVRGINFMGQFPPLFSNQYILVIVDYVSNLVEAIALPTKDAKEVIGFLKKYNFTSYGTPQAIVSDRDIHFCNRQFELLLSKYGVRHRIATIYHPQTTYHLLVVLEHRAYWAIRNLNFDLKAASEKRLLQLNEMNGFRLGAYENAKLYKEHTKKWHDIYIQRREIEVRQKVLLYDSRLKIFLGKLRSRWSSPYTITNVFPHRAMENTYKSKGTFKVNGQWLKHY